MGETNGQMDEWMVKQMATLLYNECDADSNHFNRSILNSLSHPAYGVIGRVMPEACVILSHLHLQI